MPAEEHLQRLGVRTAQPRPETSGARFPDGGAWRVEIPSVEGPAPLEAVLEEAYRCTASVRAAE